MPGGFRQNTPVTSLLDVSLCSTCPGQTDHRNFHKDGPPREWTHSWELKSATVCFWGFFCACRPLDWAAPAWPNGPPSHRWLWRAKVAGWDQDWPGCSLISTCKYVPKVSLPLVLSADFCKWMYSVLLTLLPPPSSNVPPPPQMHPPHHHHTHTQAYFPAVSFCTLDEFCPVFSL